MKGLISFALVVGLVCGFGINISSAAWWGKKDKEEVNTEKVIATESKPAKVKEQRQATPVIKTDREREQANARKKDILAARNIALNNTRWEMELAPAGNQAKKQVYYLNIQNNQISTSYGSGEFPATNYTLSINDDNTIVIETMQTSDKQGVAFWRLEITPDLNTLRGILSHQLKDKTNKDYAFTSTKKELIKS